MNYAEISKSTTGHLYQAYASLKDSPLKPALRVLLELRVSQINGCKYCCNLHRDEAKKIGIDARKIDQLQQWRGGADFAESEQEALAWAETLTTLSTMPKVESTRLSIYFSDREIVDITLCISLMNALNRLAISLRD